jgi:FkbM family methyltransferase
MTVRSPRKGGKAAPSLEERAAEFLISPRVRADAAGYLPPMVSYAQNFEDVILRRALQDVTNGFYVDVGAWDPVRDSVTAWFYEIGWRGVNIEPNPEYFGPLAAARPEDVNLPVVVGAAKGRRDFTVLSGTGLSSGAAGAPAFLAGQGLGTPTSIKTSAMTLEAVFDLAAGRTIDFLKVDVEGMENEVLGSAGFKGARPRVVVVEATEPNTQFPTHEIWEVLLTSKGYALALFDGLNRFYLRAEDAWRRPIFATPPNVFDNFMNPTRLHQSRRVAEALAKAEGQVAELRRLLGRRRRRRL